MNQPTDFSIVSQLQHHRNYMWIRLSSHQCVVNTPQLLRKTLGHKFHLTVEGVIKRESHSLLNDHVTHL